MESIVRLDGGAPKLTIEAMVQAFRALERQAPAPVTWAITIQPGTYRALWNRQSPMRRKIARLARQLKHSEIR